MSTLQNTPANSGRSSGKAPERSNFLQTCNLLSQFIKGKATIRDLNFGITGKSEVEGKINARETATTDFLTIMEKPSIESKEQGQISIDPVAQNASKESSRDIAVNETSTSKEVPKAAQLTMFYDGKVIVFDDFPADKARAVMLLASKGCPQTSFGTFQTTNIEKFNNLTANRTDQIKPSTIPIAPLAQQHKQQTHASLTCTKTEQLKPASVSVPLPQQLSNKTDQVKPGSGSTTLQNQQIQSQIAGTSGSDLPIARRSSLHRFLEKRKDRASARAPYQVHNNNQHQLPSSSNNGEPSSSKSCDDQIDLNFKL